MTPFAPPFLRDGDLVVSHVANILHYLGPKFGLAPKGEAQRLFVHGLQLTITDFIAEAHDTHHPISTDLYYEDQKKEAKARAAAFLAHRVPKYLGYFERLLQDNPAGPAHVVGAALTAVDLSLFQLWAGMTYAFPRGFAGPPRPGRRSPRSSRRWKSGRTSRTISPRSAASRSTNWEFSAAIRSSTSRPRRRDAENPEHILIGFVACPSASWCVGSRVSPPPMRDAHPPEEFA